jgi:hypothetical protein
VASYVIDLFKEDSTQPSIAAPEAQGHPALLGRSSQVCAMRVIGLVAMFHVEPIRVDRNGACRQDQQFARKTRPRLRPFAAPPIVRL